MARLILGAVYLDFLLLFSEVTDLLLIRQATQTYLTFDFSPLVCSTACLLGITGVLAPILEETVFRGFLMVSLTMWYYTNNIFLGPEASFQKIILEIEHYRTMHSGYCILS